MNQTQTQQWWCRYCKVGHQSLRGATGVICAKGHEMKRVESDKDRARDKVEGVKA